MNTATQNFRFALLRDGMDFKSDGQFVLSADPESFFGSLRGQLIHSLVGQATIHADNDYIRFASELVRYMPDNRIVWCGMYADSVDSTGIKPLSKYYVDVCRMRYVQDGQEHRAYDLYYEACHSNGYRITDAGLPHASDYLLNMDKKLAVRIPVENGRLHPMPLLCAYGNSDYVGDYMRDLHHDIIGLWAFDRIRISDDTADCRLLDIDFGKNIILPGKTHS